MKTIADILILLNQPVDKALLKTKRVGKSQITYISWVDYCELLDRRCGLGGWSWDVVTLTTAGDRLFLTGKLTIIGEDGTLTMTATGCESLNCSSYGDPSSNAEAMALRRCCAKFGLSRELWIKDEANPPQLPQLNGKGVLTKEQWQAKFAN
jgi:hypothetical protein